MLKGYSLYLQRTLDLAAWGVGKVFTGPLLGWLVLKGHNVIEESESSSASFPTSYELMPPSWQNSILFLSANPFADEVALASFCTKGGVAACHLATNTESPIRLNAMDLNRRYLTWLHEKRPYIILKWAETADGFMARSDYQPYWISNSHSRKLVHQWRSQEAAIWVGKNTYHHDNPRLNVRDWEGRNPIRVVIDPQLQLSEQLHVFDQSQPTLCYNNTESESYSNLEFVRLTSGIDSWKDRVEYVFADLHRRQVQSVFVEGGSILLSFLLENEWWDEARAFGAAVTFGEGIKAPVIAPRFYSTQQRVSDNTLTVYRRVPLEAK